MHAHAGEERFITIDNAISYSRPSSIHTTTNSSANMISLVDSEDDESDLPALADASDSETSSLCSSDYDARHNSHGNGATISSNINHGPMKDDDSPKTTHASPPPSSPPTSNLSSTCASLFCIPELFSCEGEPPSSPLDCFKTHPQSQNTTTTTTTTTSPTATTTATNIRRVNSVHPTKITYLQNIQTNIQHDILNLLGNQSSIFCCLGIRDQDTPQQHGHHHGHIHNPQSQQSRYDHNVQRRGNRNVYMRKNAMKRIESLRGSGLCKNFSFARFSLSAQEEEDINTSKTVDDDPTDRTRIGISHSIDWSGLQHGRTSQGWTGRGPDSILNHDYHGHDSNTVLGCSTKQTMMAVPSFDSVASEVELYYDSDPGPEGNDSMPQPRKKTYKAGDIASEGTKRRKQRGGDGMGTHTHTRTGAALSTSAMGMLQTYDVPSFDINDAHKVSQLIAELTAGSYTLIYHPHNMSYQQKQSTPHPLLVKCWFELGSCLKNTLVQPKFAWQVIAPTSKELSRRSRIKTIFKTPRAVELLNVVRLLVPTNVDRSIYPFVKLQNSFFIHTSDQQEYLFEARNEEERIRFLFAMKLMVARLASKIIVGEKDVFDEFFSPTGKKKNYVDARKGSSPTAPSASVDPGWKEEETSVASATAGSIYNAIVAPINAESGRNDELWGKSAY